MTHKLPAYASHDPRTLSPVVTICETGIEISQLFFGFKIRFGVLIFRYRIKKGVFAFSAKFYGLSLTHHVFGPVKVSHSRQNLHAKKRTKTVRKADEKCKPTLKNPTQVLQI